MRIVPSDRQTLKQGDFVWHLEVIGKPFYAKIGRQSNQFVVCVCRCGAIVVGRVHAIRCGDKKSCGCWHDEVTSMRNRRRLGTSAYNYKNGAGSTHTRIYRIWRGMKDRCFNPKCKDFKNYGGRGISVCQQWLNDFLVFRDWAMQNGYDPNLTIEREDVDGHYDPGNCTWIPPEMQLRNRRNCRHLTIDGETRTMSEWCRDEGCTVTLQCLCRRLQRGVDPRLAVFSPSRRQRKTVK